MLFLVGHRFDWDKEPGVFSVDAVVMVQTPSEALSKFEQNDSLGYYMGELNLVGGCIWEAREALVIT